VIAPALAQCALCGSAAGSSRVGLGLSLSVLFLLAALFLTVGWLVLLAVRASGRAGVTRAGGPAPADPHPGPERGPAAR
jgi:hypothetical protein